VSYWKLESDLRAKLEFGVFGAVWLLIWLIWGSFRPPGAVATDIRADSTLIRRYVACQIGHYFDTILAYLWLI
jgi:hypothetical protein